MSDFIGSTLWLLTSPDLNPVDYSICSVLQEKVYQSRIANVEELETRLIDKWARFDQSIVGAAINQWRRRLTRQTGLLMRAHPFTLPLKDDKQCIPHVLFRALLPPVQL